jgi:hypothetical protein
MAFTTYGFVCDDFKSGGLHEKHAVTPWYLGTISEFASRWKKSIKPVSRWAVIHLNNM